jgi:hypothetical protein
MRREDKRRVRAAMLVECRNTLRRTWVLASPAKVNGAARKMVDMAIAREKHAWS